MFDFIMDLYNYEDRKVDRTEKGNIIIDTEMVSDGDKPFETGVCHPKYNDGEYIIVEAYDTKGEAQIGHNKWVEIMTIPDNEPEYLMDCCNSKLAQMIDALGGEEKSRFPRIE